MEDISIVLDEYGGGELRSVQVLHGGDAGGALALVLVASWRGRCGDLPGGADEWRCGRAPPYPRCQMTSWLTMATRGRGEGGVGSRHLVTHYGNWRQRMRRQVVGQGKEKSPMEKEDARGRGDGPNLQGGDPSGLMPRSRIGRKKLWAE
jgi:hypothetical protein